VGRLASDIGGTFTDLVYFDEDKRELKVEKSLTTPKNLTVGVEHTISLADIRGSDVDFFVHGGTTVINAITERKGAKTALVTTSGFRDVLEIARGNRPDLYNLNFEKPAPFVPRRLRFEVRGRVDSMGKEIEPLILSDLNAVVDRCRAEKVEAIAIQLLHSYVAPDHEKECAEFLRKKLPNISVTASYEITREWREYERANTAVLNAYVQPIVHTYFDKLEDSLVKQGLTCPFGAMQSNGGSTSFAWAKEHPITLVESGPSAGVNGAALVGKLCHEEDIIYLDIGGTTAKCSVIEGGQVKVTTDYKLEWTRINPGYPVKVPVVDIVEIGTGGGSIAWFDRAGGLKVGPVSAGSDPGPASYGQGGLEPTVTDAKLLTGVLDPSYFADGRIQLDVNAAQNAMQKIAKGLNCGVEEAAVAVLRIADADAINALKLVSIQRGHDPRDFVLIVGGGGGAMHAATLGRELGVREIIIPLYPGYFSAWGMLATKPRRDFVQTALERAENMTGEKLLNLFSQLKQDAETYFREQDNAQINQLNFEFGIDLRYLGQEHWVTVTAKLEHISVDQILNDFHVAHERAYTFLLENTAVEFVNFRLTATAEVPRPQIRVLDNAGRSESIAEKGLRPVHFGDDGTHDTRIFDRDLLPSGFETLGPVIIEEPSSNTIVHPDQRLQVDELGFLHITQK